MLLTAAKKLFSALYSNLPDLLQEMLQCEEHFIFAHKRVIAANYAV